MSWCYLRVPLPPRTWCNNLWPLHTVCAVAGIKGLTKSRPHFWNGSKGTCGILAVSVGSSNRWHRSHCLQYRYASFCIVGHHKPAYHIFLAITSIVVAEIRTCRIRAGPPGHSPGGEEFPETENLRSLPPWRPVRSQMVSGSDLASWFRILSGCDR